MANDSVNIAPILALIRKSHEENFVSLEQANFSEEKLEATFQELNLTFKEIVQKLSYDFIDIAAVTTIIPEWKYLCLNFYCLHLLNAEMNKEDILSVAQTKDLRNCVKTMVHVGILQNLNPKLPHYKPLRQDKIEILNQYYMLKGTVCGLFKYAMLPTLRYHILPNILHGLLAALFQLAYCPIKKPLSCIEGEFLMTEEFYGELLGDQDRFQGFIETVQNSVAPSIFIKEIMILFRANSPNWFKKAVSGTLTGFIKQKDGLENIVRTMLAGVYDNNTTIWKVIDIITQIVASCVNSSDFKSRMCPQIDDLLKIALQCPGRDAIAFEKLYSSLVKSIYPFKQEQTEVFLNSVFVPLKELSNNAINIHSTQQRSLFSREISQTVRVIHYVFLDTLKDITLPVNMLTPFVGILFNIYVEINDSEFISLKSDLRDIILKYMKYSERPVLFLLFDNFLFNLVVPEFLNFRRDVVISANSDDLFIEFSNSFSNYDVLKSAHTVYALCKSTTKLFLQYFGFLLYCLINSDKYFPDISLLESESEAGLSIFERKIAIYEMLTILSGDGMKNKYFAEQIPEETFVYFDQVFNKSIKTLSHSRPNDPAYQLVFTIAMILEDIVRTNQYNLNQMNVFKSVKIIHDKTSSLELKALLNRILSGNVESKADSIDKDVVEEAIQETYDESIPMKGHGLIVLERLVSSKHPKVLERKQYIFTIFKENLSNRDTYIYQASIKGLSNMVDLGIECTDMVLETLCGEYAEFSKDEFGQDANEIRLKIGEVLVQISKKLGEMAPNYKALLLNTFLNGTKDDDPLIRASSLANLGEICNVLGYKLGPIVTEILVCVHSIISTDKECEPRRAAVVVIRQLLSGLGVDMLSVLKDDILLIYRTLKFLCANDKDDVLILHTQLALEELSKNMKDLMLPQVEVEAENKIVVLK